MTKPLIRACLCAGLIAGPAYAQSEREPIERAAEQLEVQRLAVETDRDELASKAAKRARSAVREAKRASKAARRAAKSASLAAKAAEKTAEAARRAASAATAAWEAASAMSGVVPPPRRSAPPTSGDPARRYKLLRVGPQSFFRRPSEAAKEARDGDLIEIEAGVYAGDVAVWKANNLTIRGVGGRAHMKAAGRSAQGKAIWVIQGDNTVIENIEFSGAKVRHRNGAGIRQEGANLTVRNGYFHDNQVGILTGRSPYSDIVIENSEFRHNVYKGKKYFSHNIYIGPVRSFTLRNSYVHHARIGHNVKSRARVNRIEYNRLMDHHDGNSSYLLDLPNGGTAYVVGNVIQQGKDTDNAALINFASRTRSDDDRLYVANNTMVSENRRATFVRNHSPTTALIINNILAGRGEPVSGPARLVGNLLADGLGAGGGATAARARAGRGSLDGNRIAPHPGFRDHRNFDYRLTQGSPAIDAGADPDTAADGVKLSPKAEPGFPGDAAERARQGAVDPGAYEFTSG